MQSEINKDGCDWISFPEHKSKDGCMIIRQSDDMVQHVFNNTSYTIDGNNGRPMVENTEFQDTVNLTNFKYSRANARCSVLSNKFRLNDFVHMSTFYVDNDAEFWWFIDSIINLWQRFHNCTGLYPREKTMTDVLVPKASTEIIFLKPIHYSRSVNDYNAGIMRLIYNLFINSCQHINKNIEKIKRPQKLYCGVYCKFRDTSITNKWWYCVNQIFGKNMYIHSICCTHVRHTNIEWYTFVKELVQMRRAECEENVSKTRHKNKINNYHKKWLSSISEINTNTTQS